MKTLIFTLLASSISGFVTFFTVIAKKFGILSSLSYSDHEFKSGWAFPAFTWWCSVPIILIGILAPQLSDLQSILVSFSGIMWAIVGAEPSSKNVGVDKDTHVAGAFGAGLLAYIFVATTHYWYIVIPALLISGYMYWKKTKNHTTWIETIAYVVNVIGLYLFLR